MQSSSRPPTKARCLRALLRHRFRHLRFTISLSTRHLGGLNRRLQLIFFQNTKLRNLSRLHHNLSQYNFPYPSSTINSFPQNLRLTPLSRRTHRHINQVTIRSTNHHRHTPLIRTRIRQHFTPRQRAPLCNIRVIQQSTRVNRGTIRLLRLPRPRHPTRGTRITLSMIRPPIIKAIHTHITILVRDMRSPTKARLFRSTTQVTTPTRDRIRMDTHEICNRRICKLLRGSEYVVLERVHY